MKKKIRIKSPIQLFRESMQADRVIRQAVADVKKKDDRIRKAFGPIMTRPMLKVISARRRKEKAEYAKAKVAHLSEHPFDQIAIALRGLDEKRVIMLNGRFSWGEIPRADHIHHRNKCRGARLSDRRWFMSTTMPFHDYVESRKSWARRASLLLPFNADADGVAGTQRSLTTDALMERAYAMGGLSLIS